MYPIVILVTICVGLASCYDCTQPTTRYFVNTNADLCLVCPHDTWTTIYWKFIPFNSTRSILNIVVNGDNIDVTKYELVNSNPRTVLVRNVSKSDDGVYMCANNQYFIKPYNVTLCRLKRQTIHMSNVLPCRAPSSHRTEWDMASVNTRIEDANAWTSVVRNYTVNNNYSHVIKSVNKLGITIDPMYNDTTLFACRNYDNNDMMYGVIVYTAHRHNTLCELYSPYCLHGGSCTSTNMTYASCSCKFMYAGFRCYTVSIYDILILIVPIILGIILYELLLAIFVLPKNKCVLYTISFWPISILIIAIGYVYYIIFTI